MRKLTEPELDQIKKAIVVKKLTSAEILLEIYDHYVSHLERFPEDVFKEQLLELEEKFTYSYCHALQAKFIKASKKEIFNLQWSIFKTYFTWPRFIATTVFLTLLIFLWDSIENRTKGLSLVIPLVFTMLLSGWIYYESSKKVRKIKRMMNSSNTVQSSHLSAILMQFSLITSSFNLLILAPKIFGEEDFFDGTYFIVASFSLFFIYVAYTLTLFEAWKTKTKTALI